jgi:hypothetical protein
VNFLLDKNAVSEWLKPRPNSGLIRWMEEADEDRVLLGGTSLVELYYGVERVAAGTRGRGQDTGQRAGCNQAVFLLPSGRTFCAVVIPLLIHVGFKSHLQKRQRVALV